MLLLALNVGRGLWFLSAHMEHDLCPPLPNTKCPHIHPLSQPCDVRDKTELKDQHSKSPRSNTWGYVSRDIVTFSSTAHSSIPPFSHCWSIHHSDRLFDLTFALSWALLAEGEADTRVYGKKQKVKVQRYKVCWSQLNSSTHLLIGSGAFTMWA